MMSPFSYFGSMESPTTSKAMVSSAIGKGSSTSPSPSADTAHDRHRIELEVIDNGGNFRGFDQAHFGQDLGNRARANAHRRCQTALGLARLLKAPLYHLDIQHAAMFLNFGKESNADFPKST